MAAADVAYEADEGYADFHSPRTHYITGLFRAGVHPKVAQVLARHSTIELAMRVYTTVAGDVLAAAVGKLALPGLGDSTSKARKRRK